MSETDEWCRDCGKSCEFVALHNARLAPQDAGEWLYTQDGAAYKQAGDGGRWLTAPREVAAELNSLTTRLREAEERNPEIGYGYYYHDGCSLTQGDGESTVMLYRTDELQAQVNKETRRATVAEARVTALEAALRSQNYIQWADDRVPGSQETR